MGHRHRRPSTWAAGSATPAPSATATSSRCAGRSTARPSCASCAPSRRHVFAYRWDANVAGIGDTLVEFTLATEGDGTRVTVVEIAAGRELRTDAEEQARLREGNVGGWKHELGDLERYAQTVAV